MKLCTSFIQSIETYTGCTRSVTCSLRPPFRGSSLMQAFWHQTLLCFILNESNTARQAHRPHCCLFRCTRSTNNHVTLLKSSRWCTTMRNWPLLLRSDSTSWRIMKNCLPCARSSEASMRAVVLCLSQDPDLMMMLPLAKGSGRASELRLK